MQIFFPRLITSHRAESDKFGIGKVQIDIDGSWGRFGSQK